MDVTCDACGAVSEVQDPSTGGDPEQDGWLYESEEREFEAEIKDPAGGVLKVPTTYQHPVLRVLLWKCDEPVHGPEGHVSRYEEEID